MKDSDVLAEKKRSNTGSYVKSAKAGYAGGAAGGILAGGGTLAATHKEREQNRFVNRRLREAQKQAVRREGKDWKQQATGREGYTY